MENIDKLLVVEPIWLPIRFELTFVLRTSLQLLLGMQHLQARMLM